MLSQCEVLLSIGGRLQSWQPPGMPGNRAGRGRNRPGLQPASDPLVPRRSAILCEGLHRPNDSSAHHQRSFSTRIARASRGHGTGRTQSGGEADGRRRDEFREADGDRRRRASGRNAGFRSPPETGLEWSTGPDSSWRSLRSRSAGSISSLADRSYPLLIDGSHPRLPLRSPLPPYVGKQPEQIAEPA